MTVVDFDLPPGLEASAPPERRDDVRLLVARPDRLTHTRFADLADQLTPGDLVVINTSGTLPAAVSGHRGPTGGDASTSRLAWMTATGWSRSARPARADGPVGDLVAGEGISLPSGAAATILAPHPRGPEPALASPRGRRGRRRRLPVPCRPADPLRLRAHGPAPLGYQTVFAREPGSAEMPSAGRPFTDRLVTDLVTRGVIVAPVLLHTGVSSQDAGEPPQPERFRVPAATARLVNATRSWGGRIVAVGTTVTRPWSPRPMPTDSSASGSGWTDLVLGPERPARVVNGLITGWHAPGASHLQLLQAVAGPELVEAAYAEALRERYLWHEFGDSCLLLP